MENKEFDIERLNKIAADFANAYNQAIISAGKVGGSKELSNTTAYIKVDGTMFSLVMELPKYWKFIEEGVNGYLNNQGSDFSFKNNGKIIPPDKLEEWIVMKPVSLPTINGKLPTPRQFAFMLGHSIKKKGLKANHILSNLIKKEKPENKLLDEIRLQLVTSFYKNLESK